MIFLMAIETRIVLIKTKSRRLPWTPTAECPDLPPHLLYTDPVLTWKMTRPHYLFSNAPVPPLLHTCFESRGLLMRHGYQLAFGTRTAAPRTWFCFHRDVLYLHKLHHQWSNAPIHNRCDRYKESSDLGIWDLDPQDLTRVRRLALDDVQSPPDGLSDASRTLRACQNVNELFSVQSQLEQGWLEGLEGPNGLISSKRLVYGRHEIDTMRDQVRSDKNFQDPLSDAAFDFTVWDQRGEAVDVEESDAALEIRHHRMTRELLSQGILAEMIAWNLSMEKKRDEEVPDGEVKMWWQVPLVRQAIVGTRTGTEALCQTRGHLRRWNRQKGSLTPWDSLPSRQRWDRLDSGPSDEGYLSCWRR